MRSKKILTLKEELARMNFVAKKIGIANFLNESNDPGDIGEDPDEVKESLNEAYGDKVLGRGYTHFLIIKNDNKIVDGWDYKGLDSDEVKHYVKIDMADNEYYGKTKNDFKLVTSQYLIKNGIDSKDTNNWDKSRYSDNQSTDKIETPIDEVKINNGLHGWGERINEASVIGSGYGGTLNEQLNKLKRMNSKLNGTTFTEIKNVMNEGYDGNMFTGGDDPNRRDEPEPYETEYEGDFDYPKSEIPDPNGNDETLQVFYKAKAYDYVVDGLEDIEILRIIDNTTGKIVTIADAPSIEGEEVISNVDVIEIKHEIRYKVQDEADRDNPIAVNRSIFRK